MSVTKKPKAKRAVEGESKQDRFVRLAKSRSVKFLNYFELLHNLVAGYTYQIEPNLAKDLLAKFEKEFGDMASAWKAAIEKAEKRTAKQDSPQPPGSTEDVDSLAARLKASEDVEEPSSLRW